MARLTCRRGSLTVSGQVCFSDGICHRAKQAMGVHLSPWLCWQIRMPTGRLQRYFTAKTPLRVVHDYCMLHEPDALAGKPFALAHALPGV